MRFIYNSVAIENGAAFCQQLFPAPIYEVGHNPVRHPINAVFNREPKSIIISGSAIRPNPEEFFKEGPEQ
jgi:hypothetical protein